MTDRAPQRTIEALLLEARRFDPPEAFRRQAVLRDPRVYEQAAKDPEGFWASYARELHWFSPWQRVLDWTLPYAKWFSGGRTNIAYNCLDRHLATRRTKAAIIWEGEPVTSASSRTATCTARCASSRTS